MTRFSCSSLTGCPTHSEENVKVGARWERNVKLTFFRINVTLETCRALTLQQCKPPNISSHVNFARTCHSNVFPCKRELYIVKNVKIHKARAFSTRTRIKFQQPLFKLRLSIQTELELCAARSFTCVQVTAIIVYSCREFIIESGENNSLKCARLCSSLKFPPIEQCRHGWKRSVFHGKFPIGIW